MIVSFVSQKGGSGKTTLSVNIAALASSHSIPVAVIDLDPQASASAWMAVRGHNKGMKVEACHPPLLNNKLISLKEDGYQIIIIDTPPHNSTAAANAIRSSNFVVVPVRPASFDLAAVADTINLIKSNNIKAAAVINAVPANTTVAESAEALLRENGLETLGRVGQRMTIQHALTAGKGVVETEPKSQSSEEIVSIWNKIVKRISL